MAVTPSTRRPRVGRTAYRGACRHVVAAVPRRRPSALFFWLGVRPLRRDRQRLRQGRPASISPPSSAARSSRSRCSENQHVSRGQLLYRLDDTPYRAGARQDRSRHRDRSAPTSAACARSGAPSARTSRRRTASTLCPGRLRAPEGPRRAQVRAGRQARGNAHGARRRAPAHRLGARRTCSASRRSSPAIRRSGSTTIPGSSRCWRRATRRCCNLAAPPSRRRWTASSPRCWCRAATPSTGVPSIAVVADTDLWIEANFKETELTRVRVGQPVTITVDTYPDVNAPARSRRSPSRPARSSPCCRRRTPPATGSRWCSASRCAPRCTAARAIRRCGSA